MTVSLSAAEVAAYRDHIHAVETYNPKHLAHHNRRATDLAVDLEVPAYGSSYAHLRRTVGEVWTTFDQAIDSESELVSALTDGVERTIAHRSGAGHRLRCLAEFGHLAWENTWLKFERVFLSGTEATHPAHVAYGGEFDDVRVRQAVSFALNRDDITTAATFGTGTPAAFHNATGASSAAPITVLQAAIATPGTSPPEVCCAHRMRIGLSAKLPTATASITASQIGRCRWSVGRASCT